MADSVTMRRRDNPKMFKMLDEIAPRYALGHCNAVRVLTVVAARMELEKKGSIIALIEKARANERLDRNNANGTKRER